MTAPVPIAAFEIAADGATEVLESLRTAPAAGGAYVWLHFDRSDLQLAQWLKDNLPPIAAQSLVQPETRPRADAFDDGIIVNLRAVNLNPGSDTEDMVSLRMWITDQLVVTVRQRKVFSVDEMRNAAKAGRAPARPDLFLSELTGKLTTRIEEVSMQLEDAASDIEEAAFDEDPEMGTEALPLMRRRVIRLRRYLAPQRDALLRLAGSEMAMMSSDATSPMRECANLTARAVEELDAARDRLNVVQDHLDAKQAARIGRNSYVLSIVAAIFLPLGFLTGLFGMNVSGLPGTEWSGAFTAVSFSMAGVGVGLYALFRALRWF
ncbi:MAG: zinc transporter ZntB [Rhodobacteraceae bacterium]|nr:zinc transporter ZntB [Paracoccaceae bacterium]